VRAFWKIIHYPKNATCLRPHPLPLSQRERGEICKTSVTKSEASLTVGFPAPHNGKNAKKSLGRQPWPIFTTRLNMFIIIRCDEDWPNVPKIGDGRVASHGKPASIRRFPSIVSRCQNLIKSRKPGKTKACPRRAWTRHSCILKGTREQ
jgi:hypothetical protein